MGFDELRGLVWGLRDFGNLAWVLNWYGAGKFCVSGLHFSSSLALMQCELWGLGFEF